MRCNDPVARVRIWDGSTPWLIFRYEDQRAALSDPRISADVSRPGFPHHSEAAACRSKGPRSFIAMDRSEHSVHRRMLTRDFTVKRVKSLRPRIQQIVDGLIDDILARPQPADLVENFAVPLPTLVICEILGVAYADRGFFHARANAVMSTTAGAEAAIAASAALRSYLGDLVEAKNADPADDLLSKLAVDQLRTGILTRADIADIAMLLLIGGQESTANMIALGTLTLLRHPDQLAELHDDPGLVDNAVEELLRYLNVTHHGLRRVAVEDVKLGGQLIKAGAARTASAPRKTPACATYPCTVSTPTGSGSKSPAWQQNSPPGCKTSPCTTTPPAAGNPNVYGYACSPLRHDWLVTPGKPASGSLPAGPTPG
ncbi:hypothetical protein BJ970_004846 [Saccharopolyspora phatthalungensis]|uniref:Cytochrome P450 n=1 Tax=Saccharopolyspora phatthalungensis TaxID=664693 RepID=A0A840Q492_9PSEU|nr:hypothetical protein [Saccharopolyspora phatthalungensis]